MLAVELTSYAQTTKTTDFTGCHTVLSLCPCCVRRAFLCGKDPTTGRSYEHRRHQIEYDLLRLASIFYIDVAAFCVMSNHHHIVVHVDRDRCNNADPKDIAIQWHQLFKAKDVSQKFVDGESLEKHEQYQIDSLIDTWRSRLHDISWFMKVLNENITRKANKEDDCTGHFWESRFKSQALLDEKAVLSAMAYVGLNPIRAATAKTPETSEHTSIKLRIEYWKNNANKKTDDQNESFQPKSLMLFFGRPRRKLFQCVSILVFANKYWSSLSELTV